MEFTNQYLTYSDYKYLGGTLQEMPFNVLEFKARKEVDKYTFNRLQGLKEQTQEVKMCIMEVISILDDYSKLDRAIATESTDGYSVSYREADTESNNARAGEIKEVIYTYLDANLIYRGV